GPYKISYRSVVPKAAECENLAVPVCMSASHIAFGSIRMEPVFMILAESSVDAISLALKKNAAVQDVPYRDLKEKLVGSAQVIEANVKNTEGGNP
ncbi:MAG: FAD-dependent oxidoreductase, partial [Spirochaetia bacterium]|nr:FAD-dependent oxidoreductase [Spirochaetia bacterium]